MAHTPGPWRIKKDSYGFWVVSDEKGENITWIGHPSYPPRDNEANARLIAAAPELLEALERALDHITHFNAPEFNLIDEADPNLEDDLRHLIAKVKGDK